MIFMDACAVQVESKEAATAAGQPPASTARLRHALAASRIPTSPASRPASRVGMRCQSGRADTSSPPSLIPSPMRGHPPRSLSSADASDSAALQSSPDQHAQISNSITNAAGAAHPPTRRTRRAQSKVGTADLHPDRSSHRSAVAVAAASKQRAPQPPATLQPTAHESSAAAGDPSQRESFPHVKKSRGSIAANIARQGKDTHQTAARTQGQMQKSSKGQPKTRQTRLTMQVTKDLGPASQSKLPGAPSQKAAHQSANLKEPIGLPVQVAKKAVDRAAKSPSQAPDRAPLRQIQEQVAAGSHRGRPTAASRVT